VSGSFKGEFEQMGAWDENLSHDDRYAMTEEWTNIIKQLWAEESVTVNGDFFKMKDCVSEPKPVTKPRPTLVCAGQSERGLRFSVKNTDICFIGGKDEQETGDISRRAKEIAKELNTTAKTFCMSTIICAETDEEAQAQAQKYRDGLDLGAVRGMLESFGIDTSLQNNAMVERAGNAFMTHTAIGSPETCRAELSKLMKECDLDGVMLIFPDYVEGLTTFGEKILPALQEEFS